MLRNANSWLAGTRGFLAIQILYVVGASLWAMSHNVAPSIELLLVLVLSVLLWRRSDRALLRGLLPFFLLLLSFQGLRGFADNVAVTQVHSEELIRYEQALFAGEVSAVTLQARLSHQWFTPALDVVASGLYMSHFLMPVILAAILWHKSRSDYHFFVFGLLLLSYAAFVTFVLYPAAPPWWAAEHGHLPGGSVTLKHFLWPGLVEVAGPNPVAAMPSLHMAYPVFIALFCIRTWGHKAAWTLLLPAAIAPITLYLGHHYVIDLLAGVVYALLALGIVLLASSAAEHVAARHDPNQTRKSRIRTATAVDDEIGGPGEAR